MREEIKTKNDSQLHSAPVSGETSDHEQDIASGGVNQRLNPMESNYEGHHYNVLECKDGYQHCG